MRALFVCVLYNTSPGASTAVKGLLDRLPNDPDLAALVWDNTPGLEKADFNLKDRVRYIAAGENMGLASAYNFALDVATARGFTHLGLLDQDSGVSDAYFEEVARAIDSSANDRIVAWVPSVRSHGRLISPYVFNRLGLPEYIFRPHGCFAVNSYSIFSVQHLQNAGGFDTFYWLDALDSRTFGKIASSGGECSLLKTEVDHRLSILDSTVNPTRLNCMAQYEASFIAEYFCSQLTAAIAIGRVLYRGSKKLVRSGQLSLLRPYWASVFHGYSAGKARTSTLSDQKLRK